MLRAPHSEGKSAVLFSPSRVKKTHERRSFEYLSNPKSKRDGRFTTSKTIEQIHCFGHSRGSSTCCSGSGLLYRSESGFPGDRKFRLRGIGHQQRRYSGLYGGHHRYSLQQRADQGRSLRLLLQHDQQPVFLRQCRCVQRKSGGYARQRSHGQFGPDVVVWRFDGTEALRLSALQHALGYGRNR